MLDVGLGPNLQHVGGPGRAASEKGLGDKFGEIVKMVAETVEAHMFKDCGHSIPEEAPVAVVKHILGMTARTMRGSKNDRYTEHYFTAGSRDPGR
jgi:hypothetical protein